MIRKAAALVLLMLLLLAGCAQTPVQTAAPLETTLQTTAPTETAAIVSEYGDCIPIPLQLSFENLEGYRELLSAVTMEDEALTDFLNSRHYSMNGINSREDILDLEGGVSHQCPFLCWKAQS